MLGLYLSKVMYHGRTRLNENVHSPWLFQWLPLGTWSFQFYIYKMETEGTQSPLHSFYRETSNMCARAAFLPLWHGITTCMYVTDQRKNESWVVLDGMMEFVVCFHSEAYLAFFWLCSEYTYELLIYFSFSFLFNKSNLSTQEWRWWQQPGH